MTVSISGENYIGTPGDAFVVSPGNLHFMGSQTDTVDYFTFLFPLKYISFCINDMLDDKLLEPLKNGHLMISPRVKDTAKELCEQLVEIYVAKNKKTEFIIVITMKACRDVSFRKKQKQLMIAVLKHWRRITVSFNMCFNLYSPCVYDKIVTGILSTDRGFKKLCQKL